MEKSNDPVNNPSHYADSCSLECFDVMKVVMGDEALFCFCVGNAFKYLWRYKNKGNPQQDLDKAGWYIDKAAQSRYRRESAEAYVLWNRVSKLYDDELEKYEDSNENVPDDD